MKMYGGTAAMQAVFGTNELLEIILSFMPLENLTALQAVSWSWKSTIWRRLDYWIQRRPPSELLEMALVFQHDRACASGPLDCVPVAQMPTSYTGAHLTTINPLLLARPTVLAFHSLRYRVIFGDFVEIKENLGKHLISEHTLSCDDMFLTQPPACYMHVQWLGSPSWKHNPSRRGAYSMRLEVSTGVRVKDLRAVLRSRDAIEWSSLELYGRFGKISPACELIFATEDEFRELTEANRLEVWELNTHQ